MDILISWQRRRGGKGGRGSAFFPLYKWPLTHGSIAIYLTRRRKPVEARAVSMYISSIKCTKHTIVHFLLCRIPFFMPLHESICLPSGHTTSKRRRTDVHAIW